jgi:arylsulfatase A-like enzyme/Flp pilus assembly protein TadD
MRLRRPSRELLLAACLLALAAGAAGARKNLLVVTVDTLRADRLGAYGSKSGATPNLDRLAAAGIVFEQAFTHTPVTLPAHATLFTGRLPFRHGVRSNTFYRLSETERTLAEILRERGYRTAAFVSAAPVDGRFGLEQGFERYDDELPTPGRGALLAERSASETVSRAIDWLRQHRGEPFFLWVHLFEPHYPYEPPGAIRARFLDAPYDGEVAAADLEIGRLLSAPAELGVLEKTLVVATSDHGEALGEHGEPTHGIFLYDATLSIPLILAGPGVPIGKREAGGPVGLVDVLPTILGLLGIAADGVLDGRDLLSSRSPGELYAETFLPRDFYNWSALRALRSGSVKFIEAPRPELYDLAEDPAEEANLVEDRRAVARELAARLRNLQASGTSENRFLPERELIAQLESLGYTGGIVPGERGETDRPDPKDRIGLVPRLDRAISRFQSGRPEEAAADLRHLLETDPENYLALHYLGEALFALGRDEEAREVYARLSGMRDSAYYRMRLGIALERLGRYAGASSELEKVMGLAPDAAAEVFGRAMALRDAGELLGARLYLEMLREKGAGGVALDIALAEVHAALGAEEAALAALHDGISRQGRDSRLLAALARLELRRGRRDAAVELLEESVRGLEGAAELGSALKLLGTLYGEAGDLSRAEARFARAAEVDPHDFEAWANLGLTRARAGETDAAIDPLARALALKQEARLLNVLAEIRFRRGELEESLALLERSLALDPAQPRLRDAVGEIQEKMKQR